MSIVELLTQLAQHDKELADAGRDAIEAQSAELEAVRTRAAELEKKFARAAHEREAVFRLPKGIEPGAKSVEIDLLELGKILDGISLSAKKRQIRTSSRVDA